MCDSRRFSSAFLPPFGEVHSIVAHHYETFQDILNGAYLVKMTLVKDSPSSVRLAGFECQVCRAPGYRVKDCPFNGICRRCRQPGHVAIALEYRNAWGRTVTNKPAATGALVPAADSARPAESAAGP